MRNTATLTQKGQVTIPVAIRRLLGLEPADKLIFSVENEKVVATPVTNDIMSLYGSVDSKEKEPADLKKVQKEVKKTVAKRIAKEGMK